ncbi:MAG: polyprenyl synthetase family protein [Ginsengibacter sp.]
MNSFQQLTELFEVTFNKNHFPEEPKTLYEAAQYLLTFGGKRIRPVLVLMGNELFEDIKEDAYEVATAVELFHNFTLVHDDIMDEAPLRRNHATVHMVYGQSTALLAGDVMLVQAYEYLKKIDLSYLPSVLSLFNDVAKKVCEGQQMDMDFALQGFAQDDSDEVDLDDYVRMIGLKTSVLLAGSIQLGAIIGGAGSGNQQHLYEFGKNLGIAFQIQDDYLDAFGDPEKFGKKPGGDILSNKKTFLLLQAMKVGTDDQKAQIAKLLKTNDDKKITTMLDIYKSCNVDDWARDLKQKYFSIAMNHLEEVAVVSSRKKPLEELANYLMNRDV